MQELKVEKEFDNKKICNYLLYKYPNLKQSTLYKALRKKDIRVNNIRISDNILVHYNDTIKVFISDEYLFKKDFNLEIIYEDKNILIINKPSGIEVTGEDSLSTECEKYINNFIKPCHRLDRNTSRISFICKKSRSFRFLF